MSITHGVNTWAGLVRVGLETAELPLMVTGVGILPAAVLAGLGMGAFGINLVCDTTIRWSTKKAMKHAEIARCATNKLNSIHKSLRGTTWC